VSWIDAVYKGDDVGCLEIPDDINLNETNKSYFKIFGQYFKELCEKSKEEEFGRWPLKRKRSEEEEKEEEKERKEEEEQIQRKKRWANDFKTLFPYDTREKDFRRITSTTLPHKNELSFVWLDDVKKIYKIETWGENLDEFWEESDYDRYITNNDTNNDTQRVWKKNKMIDGVQKSRYVFYGYQYPQKYEQYGKRKKETKARKRKKTQK
jgi:hypothetical protein